MKTELILNVVWMTNHSQGQVEEIQVQCDPHGYLEIALLRDNVFFLVKIHHGIGQKSTSIPFAHSHICTHFKVHMNQYVLLGRVCMHMYILITDYPNVQNIYYKYFYVMSSLLSDFFSSGIERCLPLSKVLNKQGQGQGHCYYFQQIVFAYGTRI